MNETEAIADRAAQSDAAAFDALVSLMLPLVRRRAQRLMGDADDAEDIVQEVFTRAWIAFGEGRYARGSGVDRWLLRITTHAALDALRAGSRRRKRHDEARPAVPAHADPTAMDRIRLREVSRFLDELPADQRVAVVLKEVEGLSVPEIAEQLGVTEGAVEQRIVRARSALRQRWSHV